MEVSASFLKEGNYSDYIKKLNSSNTDYIHFDVMDGKFVKQRNLTVSELEKYIKLSEKKKDVHLMVKDPTKYIEMLSLHDISYITIHREIKNFEEMINKIKSYGFRVGVAINPETPVKDIIDYLPQIDLVLVMSVHPGKSGQKFMVSSLKKLEGLRNHIQELGLNTKISIDGGIGEENYMLLQNTDIIVSATFILEDLNNIDKIKSAFN